MYIYKLIYIYAHSYIYINEGREAPGHAVSPAV